MMTEGTKRLCMTKTDEEDRISNLPRNVIDQILSCLSTRDGARTSALSKTWRYIWSELPYVVFDYSFSSSTSTRFLKFPDFASIVDHVLFLHRGTILKFKYSTDTDVGNLEHKAMDRWIMHLSRSPIQKFAIRTRLAGYCLPPCLFYCQSLTGLWLTSGCTIKLPGTFKGFPNLKSLYLGLKIVESDLEKLIAKCPVLENLSLKISNDLSHVTVVAPNLVCFRVKRNVGMLNFENTSCLADVSILLHGYIGPKFQVCSNSSHLQQFCAQLPMIQKLKIGPGFLKYLAVGNDPSNLPISRANLDSLTLFMNLNRTTDCLGAQVILSIFQNLRKLSIEVSFFCRVDDALTSSDGNIWEDERLSCRFNNLQLVDIKGDGITGTHHDLEFIEFVLSSSPVLERMVIKANNSENYGDYENYGDDKNRMMMVVKKLLSFKRASAQAQVIFEDY